MSNNNDGGESSQVKVSKITDEEKENNLKFLQEYIASESYQKEMRKDLGLTAVFSGPRGSGKTLSMTYFAVCFLVRGYKVWSNYPISFNFSWGREYPIQHFEATPLDMHALYTFDETLNQGIVCIDEINLWASNRRSMSVANRLINSTMQLIRKRRLTFLFTVQNFEWLDNQLRWQTDLLFRCRDTSHWTGRERGEWINWHVMDMSGLCSGISYSEWARDWEWYFHGRPLWPVYDTEKEFDILAANRPVELKLGKDVIHYKEDIEGSVTETNGAIIRDALFALRELGAERISVEDMKSYLQSCKIQGDTRQFGKYLKQYGYRYKQTRQGNFYVLEGGQQDES